MSVYFSHLIRVKLEDITWILVLGFGFSLLLYVLPLRVYLEIYEFFITALTQSFLKSIFLALSNRRLARYYSGILKTGTNEECFITLRSTNFNLRE